MANIQGGALEFEVLLKTGQINSMLEETKRRLLGFSDATVAGGAKMEAAYQSAAQIIEKGFTTIGDGIRTNQTAIDELRRKYKELSDAATEAFQKGDVDKSKNLQSQSQDVQKEISARKNIVAELEKADAALVRYNRHLESKNSLDELQRKYEELSAAAAEAFQKGNDSVYNQIAGQGGQLQTIQREITERKKVVAELEKADADLVKYNQSLEDNKNKIDNASNANIRFSTQLLNVKNQMMQLEQAGKKNTAEYARLVEEAKRLTNAMQLANSQIKTLTGAGPTLQGLVSGLSGVSGAFTAVNGVMGLFSSKSEDLQRIMLKVQSLMSITMGLQAVSSTINQTSAFHITVIKGIHDWWEKVVEKANLYKSVIETNQETGDTEATIANTAAEAANTAAETANTVAEAANTVAETANTAAEAANTVAVGANTGAKATNTVATNAGTIANIGLAGAFRLVGAAIKSIPVFGWIVAGISALVGVISIFTGKAREAKKEIEEFNKKVAEAASQPVTSLMKLSAQWTQLGDNIDAKTRLLKENATEIKNLTGQQLNLNQADELFIKNTQKYLEALMLRAKAKVKSEEYQAKIQTLSEKQERYKQVQDEVKAQKAAGTYSRPLFSSEESDLYREINQLKTESEKILEDVVRLTDAEKKIFASFKAETDRLLEGSITKLKEEISELQKEYDNAATDLERSKLFEQIQAQKELLSKMDLFDDDKGKGKDKGKDPFTEQLETAKKSYKEYYEMINAGLGEEANQAFPDLLQGGDSYKTYLENQRKSILAAAEKTQTELSKTQKKKLAKLNAEIAGETKKTVMSEFQKDLEREKNKAGNVLDLIKLIETKLKEVESSDDPLKQQKMEILVKESEDANQKAEDETDRLLQSYTDYLNEKITFELQYGDRRKKLELELEAEINEEKRRMILAQLEGLEKDRKKYEKQTGDEDYDKLIQEFRTFEQKKFDIEEEFNEKRKKLIDKAGSSSATEKERTEATEALKQQEKKMQEELSKLAVDELTKSEDWVKLFGNLDELTGKEIDNLVEKIETQLEDLSVELSPADAKALKDSLKKAKDEVVENNPFKALIRSVEEYSKAEDEQSKRTALREIFKNVSKSLNTVSQGFSGVVNAIKEMGIEMDETTAEMLENINGLIDASAKLAAGIASQNPMAIVEASIDIIKYGIGLLDSGATRRNRQLAEEYEYYNALADTFDMLIEKQEKLFSMKSGHEVTEAYEEGIKMVEAKTVASRKGLEAWFSAGAKMFSHSNWYNYDKGMGRILSRQKLLTMSAEEWNDFLLNHAEHWARLPQEVKNYANSVMEAGEQIESLTTAMQEALTGVSLDELASGIMDLVSQTDIAFSDISESFYNNMKKAVMRLVQNKTLGSAIEEWYQDFVAAIDNDDKITDDEAERLRRQYTEIIEQGRKEYESMMKVIGEEADTANVNSLAGAIKGASQESIDILAGTTNAVRDNQVRSIEVLRNQLLHLASIDMKIGVSNVHLESIDSKLGNTYDFLRAQGL